MKTSRLIGHRLIKPKYLEQANQIAGFNLINEEATIVIPNSKAETYLSEAGLLNTWYKKIYSHEILVGDCAVVWDPDSNSTDSDTGRIGRVKEISDNGIARIGDDQPPNLVGLERLRLATARERENSRTVFKMSLNRKLKIVENTLEDPEVFFDHIVHLGRNKWYGDIFKAWMGDEENFSLCFGKKGITNINQM